MYQAPDPRMIVVASPINHVEDFIINVLEESAVQEAAVEDAVPGSG